MEKSCGEVGREGYFEDEWALDWDGQGGTRYSTQGVGVDSLGEAITTRLSWS